MAKCAHFLLFAICIQFGPSSQQLTKLRKRLDYMDLRISSVTLKTQLDISELHDAIELLSNKSEGEVSAHANVSPLDAAAIAGLESDMKKANNLQDLTIAAISKAVSDEKKYTRQQMETLDVLSETIANQSIDEIKSDLMETKQVNSKLKQEVREVKSDLMVTKEMKNKLKKEVEENKEEILELRQMIMEMEQKIKGLGYSPAAVTVPSTVVTVPAHLPLCPDSWLKFKDTCYLYVKNEKVSWDVAKNRCINQGGILAEPDTEEKMRYLLEDLMHHDDGNIWLGGTDRQTEGAWVWSDSQRNITFFLWAPDQPNNWRGNQDCLEKGISRAPGLNDEHCTAKNWYICEKQVIV